MKPNAPVLRRRDYTVETVDLATCRRLVEQYHYSQGGANTATFRHGLFHVDDPMTCLGVAWWLPPTKTAANAIWPANWQGVLTLSRLVIEPEVPQNAASFLIAASVKLIRRDPRWECLVTYADEMQGHTGAIYAASGWEQVGRTSQEARWVDTDGRMVARKAGPRTRTTQEMLDLGYRVAGRSCKRRFRLVLRPDLALNGQPEQGAVSGQEFDPLTAGRSAAGVLDGRDAPVAPGPQAASARALVSTGIELDALDDDCDHVTSRSHSCPCRWMSGSSPQGTDRFDFGGAA